MEKIYEVADGVFEIEKILGKFTLVDMFWKLIFDLIKMLFVSA